MLETLSIAFLFASFSLFFSTKGLLFMLGIAIMKMEDYNYMQGYVNQMEEYAKAILDETAIMKTVLDEAKAITEVN